MRVGLPAARRLVLPAQAPLDGRQLGERFLVLVAWLVARKLVDEALDRGVERDGRHAGLRSIVRVLIQHLDLAVRAAAVHAAPTVKFDARIKRARARERLFALARRASLETRARGARTAVSPRFREKVRAVFAERDSLNPSTQKRVRKAAFPKKHAHAETRFFLGHRRMDPKQKHTKTKTKITAYARGASRSKHTAGFPVQRKARFVSCDERVRRFAKIDAPYQDAGSRRGLASRETAGRRTRGLRRTPT